MGKCHICFELGGPKSCMSILYIAVCTLIDLSVQLVFKERGCYPWHEMLQHSTAVAFEQYRNLPAAFMGFSLEVDTLKQRRYLQQSSGMKTSENRKIIAGWEDCDF